MRRAIWIMLAALTAACATTSRPTAGEHWLVGAWLMLGPDVEFPLACASGLPIRYDAGGRYVLFEGSGTWQLDGDRLTEIATGGSETADEGAPEIGRPYVSRIEQTGPDAFRKTYADGDVETFRRCPAEP